jgi:uncharacterized hydrophobic protein (TIGR00271 family)
MPSEWVTQNRFDPGFLPVMEEKLYFEGAGRVRAISNYIVLLSLATAIATYGLISASSATVIGAMIVAPLMTPIMATTLAIVLGNGPRVSRSVLIVGLSIAYVVGLAAALSVLIPSLTIGFGSNPEILGRVSPNMIALYAALASGAAGAFAVSRADVGDTLPGVAIAISLVPPLCVVGISLSHVQWLDAFGALILFMTNFFAIVLAGGAVFWLSGVHPRPIGAAEAHIHRRALAAAVLGMFVVALVLGFNGYRTFEHSQNTQFVEQTVGEWLNGTSYIEIGATLTYPPADFLVRGPARAQVVIAGTGTLPPIERLAAGLEAKLGHPVGIELHVVPQEVLYYPQQLQPLEGNETNPVETAPSAAVS